MLAHGIEFMDGVCGLRTGENHLIGRICCGLCVESLGQ